jgi:hypothetical protein
MRARYIFTTSVVVIWCLRIADWMSSIVASSIRNGEDLEAADREDGRLAKIAHATAAADVALIMGSLFESVTTEERRKGGNAKPQRTQREDRRAIRRVESLCFLRPPFLRGGECPSVSPVSSVVES